MLHNCSHDSHTVNAADAAPGTAGRIRHILFTALLVASVSAVAAPPRYRVTVIEPGPEFKSIDLTSRATLSNRGEVLTQGFFDEPKNGRYSNNFVWNAEHGKRQLPLIAKKWFDAGGLADDGTVYGTVYTDQGWRTLDQVFSWTESGGPVIAPLPRRAQLMEFTDVTPRGVVLAVFLDQIGRTYSKVQQPDGSRSTTRRRYYSHVNDAGQFVKTNQNTERNDAFVDLDGSETPLGYFGPGCDAPTTVTKELSATGAVVGFSDAYGANLLQDKPDRQVAHLVRPKVSGVPGHARQGSRGWQRPEAEDCGRSQFRAFLWRREGGMLNLGTLPGKVGKQETYANSVNSSDTVVGTAELQDGVKLMFVWTAATGMLDANLLIDPDDPAFGSIQLESGLSINEGGQMLAAGISLDGLARRQLIVLTPVTP